MERLERFEVIPYLPNDPPLVDLFSGELTGHVLQLVQASDKPLDIKHLHLQFAVEDYDKLNLILSRFPSLVSFDMRIDLERMNLLANNFPFAQSLECIRGLEIGRVDWYKFGVAWLNSKHTANVGLNVNFVADFTRNPFFDKETSSETDVSEVEPWVRGFLFRD
jgi:hypothetical protein